MNNGRFDLKRKLAFVAALAFAANSAGSLSAAGAEAALTAAGSEPATVGVPGDAAPPPPHNGDDEFENVTYNIVINGIALEDDMFKQLLRQVFGTEGSAHSYNAESGTGSVTIGGYHSINKSDIVISDDTKLVIDSDTDDTFVFNTYFKVYGYFSDDKITMTGRDGDTHYQLNDGYCRSGTVLEIAPTEYYILGSGAQAIDIAAEAPINIRRDNYYNDGYELIIDETHYTVSPKTFSLDIDRNVFDVQFDGHTTELSKFRWKDINRIAVSCPKKQALFVNCEYGGEFIELFDEWFNCSTLTLNDKFRYKHDCEISIQGVDRTVSAMAVFGEGDDRYFKKYEIPVVRKEDSNDYELKIPYLAGDGYCLSSYTYGGSDEKPLTGVYDDLTKDIREKSLGYKFDCGEIQLVYRKLADSENMYIFQPEADLFERNDRCYTISSMDALVKLMDFTSLFDGSTVLYDVYNKSTNTVEHKKFVIGGSSREFSENLADSSKSALYIVKNIISQTGDDVLRDGLGGVICFYSDKTAPKVEFTRGENSDNWVGMDGMSFAMKITDNEKCPVGEKEDLTFEEGEISDIYKNYINKETKDCGDISSVVVGDYRFDRPADGWGDTAKIKGYVETPDMREKYNAAVSVLSKIRLADINSRYSEQLNCDGYYRELLREHSASLMDDINEYYNAEITAEEAKEEPDSSRIDELKRLRDKYAGVVSAYKAAQETPVRTSKCVPVLTYDKDTKEFAVSVKAEAAHANEMIDEWLRVFALDDSNNSSYDSSDRKHVRVKIDGAPPAVSDNKITITGDEVITDEDGKEAHVLKAGSTISAVLSDVQSSVDGSGISDVKIYFGDDTSSEKKMTFRDGKYIFDIVEDAIKQVNIKTCITIYAIDSVGNPVTIKSTDSKYGGFNIIIDDTAPECSVKNASDSEKSYVSEGKEWYKAYSDVKIAVSAEDPNSGIGSGLKELKLRINGHDRTVRADLQSGIDRGALSSGKYVIALEAVEDSDRFRAKLVSTADGSVAADFGEFSRNYGSVKIELSVKDFAGNESSRSEAEVWVDLAVPSINDVIADGVPLRRDQRYGYVYFAREQAVVRVSVNGNGPSAGIDSIKAVLVNSDGTPSAVVPEVRTTDDPRQWEVVVPQMFRGYMRLSAVSRMGRESEMFETALFMVEKDDDHRANANITLDLPPTSFKDVNGVPLYADDIDADIRVKENFSGIADIRISASGAEERSLSVNDRGEISENGIESWSADETSRDMNTVREISAKVKLTGNSNNNSVYAVFDDRAGNPSEDKAVSRSYSIDKTDPVMNVVFTDANGSADNEFKQIYKNTRKAVITINERNFDKSLPDIRVNNSRRELEWRLINGTAGTDSATYQAEIAFDNDGTYRLTADFKDMCGRAAKSYDSGEFVIDRTAPAMNIGFDKKIANEHFYNEPTTATFRISDQNFEPSRVVMTGTYNNSAEEFPKASEWVKSGNDYVSTVKFEKDGEYTVNITGKDKAGNTLEAYNAKFCIDSQSPKISVSDVNTANNKKEIRPHIQFKDVNLDKDSIKIKLEGANRGSSLDFEGELRESADGYEYVFNNIPDKADFDDIYTIKASAKDSASNKVEKDFRFSVNRYGSTFMLDEGTGSIVGKYISKAQDIVISEVNANKHSEPYSVYITKDSEMAVLKDNVDYKVEYTGGDDEWSEYKYIIYAKNFEGDGRYTVSIHSVDEAGNINVSTSEKKNSYLEFCVDTTQPLCIPLNLSANSAYKGERLEAKMSVSDNIMLKGAKVFVDDKEIRSRYIDDEYLEFTVRNAKHAQNVRVVLTDMAGNEIEYSYKNILVTTNAMRILAHKTWFKFVCGGIVLLGGAAAFLIRKRKNRLL